MIKLNRGLWVFCLYASGCEEWKGKINEEIFWFVELSKNGNIERIENCARKTHAFYYIQLIARDNNQISQQFPGEEINRAYWLGGESLRNHNTVALNSLKKANNLSRIPPEIITKTSDCLVLPGRVNSVDPHGYLLVETLSVVRIGKRLFLQEEGKRVKTGFIKKPEEVVGLDVSIHLGIAREKISAETARRIVEITRRSLESIERAQAK